MEAFINATACISHYNTVSDNFFFEEVSPLPGSNFLFVTPPVYKDHIPANYLRRASHILKMGIAAGLICLRKNGSEQVDAIIAGTGMGCFEDTDKFLRNISDNDEEMLNPTAFIQSTHNTIAGQLALLVKCHGYNFTYVQQNLSFEYALLDALLLLKEKEAGDILVGGVDELVPPLCELFERAGHIKKAADLQIPLWESNTGGYVAGEGAAFFRLAGKQTNASIARISGIKIIHDIKDAGELSDQVNLFLTELGLKKENIGLILSGVNGDVEQDKHLKEFNQQVNLPVAYFKHLCGEYFTAGSFALWFAAGILQKQSVPACAIPKTPAPVNLKHVLIINHFQGQQYAITCVSQC